MSTIGLLVAVANFFVEPTDSARAEPARVSTGTTRPVIAVAGLGARCGTTTVARALGAELALRDPAGAALVTAEVLDGGALPLGTPAAGRLTRSLSRALPLRTRTIGRVCLTACSAEQATTLADVAHELAPLVLDVSEPSQVAVAASVADAVVLVGSPATEPALAVVLADSLRRVGPDPLVALNRDRDEAERWSGRCTLRLPESRMGAQLALAGREPRGRLGGAIAELADLAAGP